MGKIKCEECGGKGYKYFKNTKTTIYEFQYATCSVCDGLGKIYWIDVIFPKYFHSTWRRTRPEIMKIINHKRKKSWKK